jgi:hypothetical protein
MSEPFILSRKIKQSILEGIDVLRFGPFVERDVKALLIDLREIAKYMLKSLAAERNEFTAMLREFVDVCDFVAHASRDRGLVERTVRDHVKTLHASLTLSPEEFSQIPVTQVLNANKFVLALAGVSSFALGKLQDMRGEFDATELVERQSEIALCILSLLQDSFISLKEEEGFGVLQLMPHEGKYRLYCRVVNSKIEREARARTGGTGKLVLGFPVMVSTADCLDSTILSHGHEVFPQPILETFRGPTGILQVRILHAGGDT